ncbi:MAG: aspartate aminotransferase family protein [Gammaproteobacteria bacterium]|nr:aspartate aminotransferase family protein [Gammaproteobacteria bacterium]MDH4313868.1 aspartate aminotransferase family protein [Gammaproteobacteria bacterium]MDH5215193.1 aspartate aminotransferase family protein [Gammaproteobacteria bacterium]MDH5499539.1 aspartate aminotransferase family protein [Gammaproteobacteria bacterium]
MTDNTARQLRADVPDLQSYWMPFTGNRKFKKNPRLISRASGVHCWTHDGKKVLDAIAGLWCCNAGHCHPKIVEAIQKQAAVLDYATAFQMSHPAVFELANKVAGLAPDGMDYVFFVNSGSEAVDTALKMALGYHRIRGEGARTRLIGRERGYHGVGFGGMSVGGMSPNRKMFGPAMLPGVDHISHTHSLEHNAYTRGQPEWGAHLAEDLERLVALHDASTIAAVIVEPIAGSTGVILPPKGYLQRLREICDKHGILLIFDEVICAFGRVGDRFGATRFDVTPDLITTAKGLTSGTVPMGAVIAKNEIYDTFMTGPEGAIEFFHGYTYSGHPLAAAAGNATLDVYREEALFERARSLEPYLEEGLHSLKGEPHVQDIRNLGLIGAVELTPIEGQPTARAMQLFAHCFDNGVAIRTTGDTAAFSPPLIIEKQHIDQIVETVRAALRAI